MSLSKALTTVFLFSFFILNSVMAQNETAEGEPSNSNTIRLPGLNSGNEKQTRYKFTAAEYFYPIKPGAVRDQWPERLTFVVDQNIDLETLKTKLQDQPWKRVFHCSGQAITVKIFRNSNYADGVVGPSVAENYSFNNEQGILNQTLYPPEINPYNLFKKRNRSYKIKNIADLGQGRFKLYMQKSDGQDLINHYTVVRVRETGELLIQDNNTRPDYDKICPDGTSPKALLVPLPKDLVS